MELLFALCLLTSFSVAPFSAAVTAAAAVTAEATSGRARRADGKHRRKAQTRRRARGELASHTNASSTASLSDSSTVGVCRATRINDPGHCESGLSGSWTTRSHGISDLEQCAAKCRLCVGLRARGLGRPYSPLAPDLYRNSDPNHEPRCHLRAGCSFISFSARSGDCSVLICTPCRSHGYTRTCGAGQLVPPRGGPRYARAPCEPATCRIVAPQATALGSVSASCR